MLQPTFLSSFSFSDRSRARESEAGRAGPRVAASPVAATGRQPALVPAALGVGVARAPRLPARRPPAVDPPPAMDKQAAIQDSEIIGPFRTVSTTTPKVAVVLYVANGPQLRRLTPQSCLSPAGHAETAENRPF